MSFWNRKKEKPQEKYKEIPFQHLAPIDTVEDKTVFAALDYALSQNNVHNIALTGNYGSGKSSILESYIKHNRNRLFIEWILRQISKIPFLNRFAKKKKWFLKISLATFAIENDDETNNSKDVIPKTTEQEIEKSILQQIFYRKSGRKFPYSHFSRIKKIGLIRKIITEIVILILLLVPIYIKKGNLLDYIQKHFFATPDKVDLILVFFCFSAFLVVLYKSISLAYKLRLAKFSFQDAEIEFEGKENEESLLNKYLDELLYFFEVTEYNVVIFEDLDRFRNTEIFIKLRELNTLLSNYEKINRKIIFVYALRDEVFKDNSRTKFFDFIIPVIPVINNQNSSDILLNLRNENPESPLTELDESFLQDVGLYVDDMRLLINSINEFKIYDKKINEDDYKTKCENTDGKVCRDRNKIFALILYKNLYPNDFALLTQNKGELYSIFQKKKDVAELEIPKIENSIIQLENQIKNIENQVEIDIKELRTIYIAKVFSEKPKNNGMYIANDISDFLSDETFERFQLQKTLPCVSRYSNGSFNYDFFKIEKEVNPSYSYKDRENMLKKKINGELEKLKTQLAEKRTTLLNIQQMSIAEMLDEFPSEQFVANIKTIKKDFIIYLLRCGFIDENYFDYISYFYANSLSEDEKQYLLLIKNQQNPNFALLIKNSSFNNVVARIKDNEWKLPAVLNYSMLYCVLMFDDSHIVPLLNTLWNYKRFNRNSLFLSKFRAELHIQSKLYTRLYDLFGEEKDWFTTLFDDEDSIVVYKFFVSVDFKKTERDLTTFLTNDLSFLHRADIDVDTVSSKINYYDLKFNLLEDTVKYSIYNILLDKNAYVISKRNFDIIIKNAFADAVKEPIKDYYTRVSKLQNPNIKAYVDQNIETFVKNVILSTGESTTESEDAFVELLNNDALQTEIKIELIEKNDCLISDITKIKSFKIKLGESNEKTTDIRNLLYKHKKVSPTWFNVFENFKFNGNKFDSCLVEYLNDNQVIEELTKEKPITEEELKNENGNHSIVSSFYEIVSESNILSIESFLKLMRVCPWHYDKMSKYDIDSTEMNVLIELKKITLSSENYSGIKENHTDLLPKYVATYFDEFLNKCSELKIDVSPDDMKLLLDSNELDKGQKNKLLSGKFDIWRTISQKDSFVWLGKKIIELEFSDQLTAPVAAVVRNLDDEEDLMKIIALQGQYLKESDITNAINNKMGEIYQSSIIREGKQKILPNNAGVKRLCTILQDKGLISSFKEDGNKIRVQQKRSSS